MFLRGQKIFNLRLIWIRKTGLNHLHLQEYFKPVANRAASIEVSDEGTRSI